MMILPSIFSKSELVEPKCKGCGSNIDWGVTTAYSEDLHDHVCTCCGELINT